MERKDGGISFDLDGEGAEFGGGHCWLPDRVLRLIKMVKDGFLADGNGKKEPQKMSLMRETGEPTLRMG